MGIEDFKFEVEASTPVPATPTPLHLTFTPPWLPILYYDLGLVSRLKLSRLGSLNYRRLKFEVTHAMLRYHGISRSDEWQKKS